MIRLTEGDTFDGIDLTIVRGSSLLDNDLVESATARIRKSDGTVLEREMTIGPEAGRFRYRMTEEDYAELPGVKTYRYQVLLRFVDGTEKIAPSVGTKALQVTKRL